MVEIGDLVQLKSGGPIMTITFIASDFDWTPLYTCKWFDDNNELRKGRFKVKHLNKIIY